MLLFGIFEDILFKKKGKNKKKGNEKKKKDKKKKVKNSLLGKFQMIAPSQTIKNDKPD